MDLARSNVASPVCISGCGSVAERKQSNAENKSTRGDCMRHLRCRMRLETQKAGMSLLRLQTSLEIHGHVPIFFFLPLAA